jgi:UDP-N-acetylmuramoyl-tripeptide--D-alanyl-D-alanine ligase
MKLETVYSYFLKSAGICTDTRNIEKGCLFVALRGDNFNGNTFTQQALDKGAFKVIIDDISQHKNTGETILCKNSLVLLQKLATYHRQKLNIPIIALTGSNGKTTTKEIINTVLSKKFKTTATLGNLNNHIGVPLTLLSMTKDTQICVVEMGANHKKEIKALCEIAEPNFGYITNFGKAHIEGFGNVQGVIEGKSELYKYITKEKGTLFFNADDPIQSKLLGNYTAKIGFSQEKKNFYTLKQIDTNPYVALQAAKKTIKSNLIGGYNFTNICAGVVIGDFFDIPLNDIKQAIEEYLPTNNRSQLITKGNTQIILDAYNANPTSMMAALQHFNTIRGDSKMVFLGDMFELGETAQQEHQKIVDYLINSNIDEIYLIGSYFSKTKSRVKNIYQFTSFEALKKAFNNIIAEDTTILIKASRGMALERILPML